jgi:hypothetical protein
LAWFKRFGLHLAAAVGATGVFVAAAAVGANQTRQPVDVASLPAVATVVPQQVPPDQRLPTAVVVRPTPGQQPAGAAVRPERSLAGTIQSVAPDSLQVVGVGGRTWTVEPAPGALIRVNGKAARLDALQPGDGVVILGQAQPRPGLRFLAHAITVRAR